MSLRTSYGDFFYIFWSFVMIKHITIIVSRFYLSFGFRAIKIWNHGMMVVTFIRKKTLVLVLCLPG